MRFLRKEQPTVVTEDLIVEYPYWHGETQSMPAIRIEQRQPIMTIRRVGEGWFDPTEITLTSVPAVTTAKTSDIEPGSALEIVCADQLGQGSELPGISPADYAYAQSGETVPYLGAIVMPEPQKKPFPWVEFTLSFPISGPWLLLNTTGLVKTDVIGILQES